MSEIELSGTWRAAPADDALLRTYQSPDFDDSDWQTIPVPGHWQQDPVFATSDGPVLHRTSFQAPIPEHGDRWWLTAHGILYQSDIWLDGGYLGDTEGWFFPHSFEVTDALRARSDHTLAVEVTCWPAQAGATRRNLTGSIQPAGSPVNPGGIWRPITLQRSGPVRIVHHRIVCRDAEPGRATIGLRAVLDSTIDRTVIVHTRIANVRHIDEHRLAAGENQLEWLVQIPDPALWWPRHLGRQDLHDVTVEIEVDDEISDRSRRRTGLRSVSMEDRILSINGERVFVEATTIAPPGPWPAENDRERWREVLDLVNGANLNLVRLRDHIAAGALYDLADEQGLLVWQDLPPGAGAHRSVRGQARRQARECVDLLAHHPSLVLWGTDDGPHVVHRALRAGDASRPIIAHPGLLPTIPGLPTLPTNLSLGWQRSDAGRLPELAALVPRLAQFVTDIGAPAVPVDDDDATRALRDAWKVVDDAALAAQVPPDDYEDVDDWALATRRHQADVIRRQVETLRRLKYRPAAGFTQSLLADTSPAVSDSIISASGIAKEGYAALRDACRPVLPIMDEPPDHLHPDEPIRWMVHVVSDLRRPIIDAVVTATLTGPLGARTFGWTGDVITDDCTFIGTVDTTAPSADGPLTVELQLSYEDVVVTNHYETRVIGGRHEHG